MTPSYSIADVEDLRQRPHTTTLMLPPGSRSGSKILQAAHQPRLGTLENQLFSTNPSDEMLY
jgi:hypothetical protein